MPRSRVLAFYAPMKSPRSPRPSGDRTLAGLFVNALTRSGFQVEVASELRSWEGRGDVRVQETIRSDAASVAERLIREYRQRAPSQRPVAWFSYHVYHKAPDWIGPVVCDALAIPYYCAEASISPRQANGPWRIGYQATLAAVRRATRIFNLNPRDIPALRDVVEDERRLVSLSPFLDVAPVERENRHATRQQLAARLRIDADRYWLLSVAMMRDDSKLKSYEQLSRTMSRMQRKDWILLIVGDGAAELQVRDLFRLDLDRQVYFLGRRERDFIHRLMSAADLLVWPAINEAIGMVALEAMAMGLPAVWGRSGGIARIIRHGQTGLLVDNPSDPASADDFVDAIESLLEQPATLSGMADESVAVFVHDHGIDAAAARLGEQLPECR